MLENIPQCIILDFPAYSVEDSISPYRILAEYFWEFWFHQNCSVGLLSTCPIPMNTISLVWPCKITAGKNECFMIATQQVQS